MNKNILWNSQMRDDLSSYPSKLDYSILVCRSKESVNLAK